MTKANNPYGARLRNSFKFQSNVHSVSGAIVGITVWKDRVIVACQYHVYELINNEFVVMKFKPVDENEPKFGEDVKP